MYNLFGRIYLFFFIFILSSCINKKNAVQDLIYTVNIDVSKVESLRYDDYFKKSTFIVLETLPESLIGEVSKLYMTDSFIIIFDKKQMAIMLFDIKGNFIRQIGKKGSAPDEYTFFNDIQFERETSLIYAHERYRNSIFTYNLDGELINKTPKIAIDFNSFCKTKFGYWVYSCFNTKNNPLGYNLMLLDEKLEKVKSSYFPQKKFVNVSDEPAFIQDELGIPYFFYPSSNIIYKLVEDNPIPWCRLDFGDKTMPYEKIVEIGSYEEYDRLVADKKFLGDISGFKVGNSIASFSFRETGFGIATKTYYCYFNFAQNKVKVIQNPFIEGMDYPVEAKVLSVLNKSFVYSISLNVCSDDSFFSLSDQLAKPISRESNPILVIADLKE